MLRFPEIESLGIALAGITEAADGDFSNLGGRPARDALIIAGIAPRPIATARQVHGTSTHVATNENLDSISATEGDALATRDTTVALAVRVADCVPVYLFDPVARALGIVHAGRRGTFDGVAAFTVRTMRDHFRSDPKSMHALIGPSAGPCCYEVDEVTAAQFHARGLPRSGRKLDLWKSNSLQLQSEGLPHGNVVVSGLCTICDGRFHSYRAHGTAARNLAIASL